LNPRPRATALLETFAHCRRARDSTHYFLWAHFENEHAVSFDLDGASEASTAKRDYKTKSLRPIARVAPTSQVQAASQRARQHRDGAKAV